MKFVMSSNVVGVLLATLVLVTSGQRINNQGKDTDIHELARQNKITQQILQYYLQRRLGLARGDMRPPSVDEILPTARVSEERRVRESGDSQQEPEQYIDEDNLQSVESEQVDSVYPDGRKKYMASSYEGDSESYQCSNCGDDDNLGVTRWTMPLLKLGEKKYYLGIFFKANWFKAQQYCRFHGMHLASISSQEENDKLEKYVRDSGFGQEHFWTSGTDLAEEGSFFWMANGRPLTFVNWNAGEPNNFRYENGEEENCLELWNRDGKGLKWNDSPCSFETYFVCEVRND